MTEVKTDLSGYTTGDYHPGAGWFKRASWYLTNAVFFLNPFFTLYGIKRVLLRMFGARIGRKVVIKPRVNIKYPWNLKVGDHSWIGEKVWLDSLGKISIGDHACISQGAMLICGNHNYKKPSFDLMVGDITMENGAWVGAGAIVGPGTVMGSHAVLTAGSVAGGHLESHKIYGGNPAVVMRDRDMTT